MGNSLGIFYHTCEWRLDDYTHPESIGWSKEKNDSTTLLDHLVGTDRVVSRNYHEFHCKYCARVISTHVYRDTPEGQPYIMISGDRVPVTL
jgi:hypothetical protein